MLIVLVGVALIAIGGVAGYIFTSTQSSGTICSRLGANIISSTGNVSNTSSSNNNSSKISLLIVEADPSSPYAGINGSYYHSLNASWPIISVRIGQTVTIHIINCASAESHGFAIAHYFDAGVSLRPGESYDLTFTAKQAGQFRVFCNIFCSIHPWMQNGELIVS